MSTLIDTSAWIAFFRDTAPTAALVDHLVESNQAAVCGPVLLELRRGIRTKRDRRQVLGSLAGCHHLAAPPELWTDAGDIGAAVSRRGRTVPSMDLLIATYALAYELPLLTLDEGFTRMRGAGIPLQLMAP